MSDIPEKEPSQLRVGDTWRWTRSLADYPAGTWTLNYRFKNAAGGFEIAASASGTTHDITVDAVTTGAYTAGDYQWMAWVVSGAEKFTIDQGSATLLPDYRSGAATAALDDRSHARKTLEAIAQWIEGRSPGVAEYEIAGRRMKYIPITDLLKLRERYKAEVANENAADALRRGEGIGRKIQFRI